MMAKELLERRRVVPKKTYFKASMEKNDDGFVMCWCGTSVTDDQEYVVTTNRIKSNEVPELCQDAKTFAELVAKLLNDYYAGKES